MFYVMFFFYVSVFFDILICFLLCFLLCFYVVLQSCFGSIICIIMLSSDMFSSIFLLGFCLYVL